jgi:signal transduction histidine kinase
VSIARKFSFGGSSANSLALALLLLLAVLAPSICLLWFMHQAAQNERLAVRQRLADAYRAHLTLAQERLETYFHQTAAELDQQAERLTAQALFARIVLSHSADSALVFDSSGRLLYPTVNAAPENDTPTPEFLQARLLETSSPVAAAKAFANIAQATTNSQLGARALQAQARCLLAAGLKTNALAVLKELSAGHYRNSTDYQGRLIAPNAQLLALHLANETGATWYQPYKPLLASVLDYDNILSASQRRFLMHQYLALDPHAQFATLAAEDLAARLLEDGTATNAMVHIGGQAESARQWSRLAATPLPGIWQFASASGRVVLLQEILPMIIRLRAVAASPALPAEAVIDFLPPGKEPEPSVLSVAAGPSLPGWRLSLSLRDSPLFEAAARQRVAAYLWIAVLVVSVVVVLAMLALGLVRRQAALTQLRNDLVANVTHELKTPLASMRLLVDTLLDTQTLNEKTTREYLELIARENLRLSRLIENFLAFSRMERNKYALDFKEVPAGSIIAGASAAVRERFNSPGCHFAVTTDGELPAVEADADAMVTALVNLLDNAFKYSGDEKQITLWAGAANGHVLFKVRDNGIGLSLRETKRIFKRFYRVEQRARATSGCGLGLSIVRFIVTAHHGDVRVESQPGQGSTFIISLPTKRIHSHQEAV